MSPTRLQQSHKYNVPAVLEYDIWPATGSLSIDDALSSGFAGCPSKAAACPGTKMASRPLPDIASCQAPAGVPI